MFQDRIHSVLLLAQVTLALNSLNQKLYVTEFLGWGARGEEFTAQSPVVGSRTVGNVGNLSECWYIKKIHNKMEITEQSKYKKKIQNN